jgi:hypothetical protein
MPKPHHSRKGRTRKAVYVQESQGPGSPSRKLRVDTVTGVRGNPVEHRWRRRRGRPRRNRRR